MPKYLGLEQQSQIVGMWNAGLSIQQISQQVAIPKSMVYGTIQQFRERGTYATQLKSGQPKILNKKDCQGLDRFISENRRANLCEIKEAIGKEVSPCTISKAIHDLGKRSCIAPKKPYLRALDFKRRLAFANQFGHWTIQQWARIIWTDKSSFELGKKSD
ncbi:hypothetical protein O181_044711 [Austropuccinia psidii MF-1]|uniref:Transposase Tc1-like domain-containing protein n=1 Tax=Austropuccinia psidii MF-1 TaxID=1389203 RepID=A0A9Q3DQY0_9BASI|nr:hypothetical protein [Austropuccinia psidii MF-1]